MRLVQFFILISSCRFLYHLTICSLVSLVVVLTSVSTYILFLPLSFPAFVVNVQISLIFPLSIIIPPVTHIHPSSETVRAVTKGTYVSYLNTLSLSFLGWPLLPSHCNCRGLLLHLITHSDIQKIGRTSLDEGSAHRREVYPTTNNTHKREIDMPPAGFEPAIPATQRPQTHTLSCDATGIYLNIYHFQNPKKKEL
jgi:hypothetical protein